VRSIFDPADLRLSFRTIAPIANTTVRWRAENAVLVTIAMRVCLLAGCLTISGDGLLVSELNIRPAKMRGGLLKGQHHEEHL
jgi:hypothetical protein